MVTEYKDNDIHENIHVAANQIYLGKSPNAPCNTYRAILAICILAGVGIIVFLVINRAKAKAMLNEAMSKKE